MKKRLICVLLCAVMAASFISSAVFATAFEPSEYGDVVYFFRDLGLISEDFLSDTNLSRIMTRGEFADIVVQIMGFTGEASSMSYSTKYSDVPSDHPYAKSIIFASQLGYFGGVSEELFAPDDPVYMSQAIKVAVCMLGFDMHAVASGGYPSGYIKVANERDIMHDIEPGESRAALRGEILALMYNTVNADMAILNELGDTTGFITSEGRNILSEYHSIFKDEGIVEANFYSSLKGGITDSRDQLRINGKLCICAPSKHISSIGKNVIFYYKEQSGKNKLLALYENENTRIVFESNEDLHFDYYNGYYEYMGNTKNEKFFIGKEYDVIYNGYVLGESNPQLMIPENGTVTLIDNNSDRIFDVVIVEEYFNLVVYTYDSYTEKITDISAKKGDFSRNISLGDYENVIITNVSGEELTKSSIKSGKVFMVYKNPSDYFIKLVASDVFFNGKITEIQSDNKIVVNSKEYKLSGDLRFDTSLLNFSDEYIFYLNGANDICYVAVQSTSELCYVIEVAKESGISGGYYIKVFTSGGQMGIFPLNEKVTVTKGPGNSASYTAEMFKELMDSDKRNLYLIEKDKDDVVKKLIYPYVVNTKDEFENMPVYPLFKLDYLINEWPESTIKNGKIQYIENQYGFGGWLAMPQAAFTFNVPVLSNTNPPDNFFSISAISQYDENTRFVLDKNNTGMADQIDVYSLNYDSFLADVLVHYVDAASTDKISETSYPAIVTSVTQGIEPQTGDEVYKINVIAGKREKTLYVDDISVLQREHFGQQKIASSLPELADGKNRIEVGDIIVYSEDTFTNRLTAIALLYDLKNNKVSYSQSGYDILFRFETATVKRVDRGYLEYETSKGVERCYLGPTSVTIYDKQFDKAYSGSVSDLAIGDKVAIYFKWTQNLSTVIYKER